MSGPGAALTGRRILVVEDEFFIADQLARDLQGAGAEVVGPCPTVPKAITALEAGGVDAALIDVHMGAENSYGLIRRLQGLGVPVILATGYDGPGIAPEFRDLPRLQKPFNATIVTETLAELTTPSPTSKK